MVVHARSGGTIEVMGLMQGKIDGDTIIIMDAFALPVEGTETRVNAQADAYEYMVQYSQTNKQVVLLPWIHFPFSSSQFHCLWFAQPEHIIGHYLQVMDRFLRSGKAILTLGTLCRWGG